MVILYAINQIIAKGYAQRKSIDYNEIFSPIVKHFYSDFVGVSGTVWVETTEPAAGPVTFPIPAN